MHGARLSSQHALPISLSRRRLLAGALGAAALAAWWPGAGQQQLVFPPHMVARRLSLALLDGDWDQRSDALADWHGREEPAAVPRPAGRRRWAGHARLLPRRQAAGPSLLPRCHAALPSLDLRAARRPLAPVDRNRGRGLRPRLVARWRAHRLRRAGQWQTRPL